jgi:transposase
VAVLIDHSNQRVLDVLESREKAVVLAYLRQHREGLLAQLAEVTVDMWSGYVEAIRETFGDRVAITVDRFHVMKNFQDQLADARREIQRQLPKAEAVELKGSRWLWLKNPEDLRAAERTKLEALKQRFPRLRQLADQREALRAIFDDPQVTSPVEGKVRLSQWMAKARQLGLQALNQFCQTLEHWLDKIANYFLSRSSNGRTEGFNHGLRSILWRAFGMTSFRHFRLRVLDRFGRPAKN